MKEVSRQALVVAVGVVAVGLQIVVAVVTIVLSKSTVELQVVVVQEPELEMKLLQAVHLRLQAKTDHHLVQVQEANSSRLEDHQTSLRS